MSCLTIFLILIILLPIAYVLFVPQTIQQKFNSFVSGDGSGSGESLSLSLSSNASQSLSITDLSEDKPIIMDMIVNFAFPAQTTLPGIFTLIGPTSFEFGFMESVANSVGSFLVSPDLSFPVNQAVNTSLSGTLSISDIQSVLSNLNSTIYIKSVWKVKIMGIQWSNIPVSSKTSLNSKIGTQIFNMYTALVPQLIQKKFNAFVSGDGSGPGESLSFSSSPSTQRLSVIDVLLRKPIVMDMIVNFGVPAQTTLSGTFTLIGPTRFEFGFTESVANPVGNFLVSPDISFPINQAVTTSVSGPLTITDAQSVLSNLNSNIYIQSVWKVKILGLEWSNVPVWSKTSLNSKIGTQIFNIALNQTSI